MDFYTELGPLAFATRLRRLTERLAQDVMLLYKEQDIDFEPRWFPVFYLLSRKAPLSIMEIATILGISHPAVNQIAGELLARKLVFSLKDPHDRRRRLLALSEQGKAMLPALEVIWQGVHAAARDLLDETGTDVLAVLERLEVGLTASSIHERFNKARLQSEDNSVAGTLCAMGGATP